MVMKDNLMVYFNGKMFMGLHLNVVDQIPRK